MFYGVTYSNNLGIEGGPHITEASYKGKKATKKAKNY